MQSFRTRQIEILSEPESSLISKIKDGDKFAFKELFRRYYNSLYRFSHRFVCRDEDAEDIVESVFEKVWLNRGKLDPNQSVKSYLFKAVQNRALDFLRGRGNNHVLFSGSITSEDSEKLKIVSCSDPAQEMADREILTAAMEAIERLPRKCKLVFTLNKQEGLSYSEIADALNISKRTVANQIVRAIRHLRKDLRFFFR